MGRRHQKRLCIALPVTVSGLDTNGNPFTQSATTVEISPRGVRLRGVCCLRARGDPVEVEYKHRRARYRVAWLGQPGSGDADVAGLEGLEGSRFLFAEHLPAAIYPLLDVEADTYVVPAAAPPVEHAAVERRQAERRQEERRQEERRRHPRYHCAGTAHIWESGQEHAVSGRLNEMSLGGCYVEMMSPMRLSATVRMELAVNSRIIRLEGVVRNSQPNFGMGVQFTTVVPPEWEKLRRTIAELSGAVAPEAPQPAVPDVAYVPGKELAEVLLRWFGEHDTLTHQDFLKTIEQVTHPAEEIIHG